MSDKPWKKTERRVAKIVGGQRNPIATGKPDVTSDWLIIEVRHRKDIPLWISSQLHKARKAAREDQLGVCLIHQRGKHDDVIFLSRKDFQEWFGWEKSPEIEELEEVKDDTVGHKT